MDRFRGAELAPGPHVQTDEQIDAFVRANLESTMHPCGSCRMGEDDMAVVDSELRVRGMEGLRVIDSSVFPTEPNGNLNAPTIMLAERASDLLRAVPMLPASEADVGLAEGWETRQRTHTPTRKVFAE
jgi:choline dehydrogenase